MNPDRFHDSSHLFFLAKLGSDLGFVLLHVDFSILGHAWSNHMIFSLIM